jgi:calcineurin-like phosphoesterase
VPDRVIGRVEVLNASGRDGLARDATDRLRSAGFDVVYFGNAPGGIRDSSGVLDRTGHLAVARAAARRLGISSVRAARDSTLFVDATIVLGTDWHVDTDSSRVQKRGWIRRWFR